MASLDDMTAAAHLGATRPSTPRGLIALAILVLGAASAIHCAQPATGAPFEPPPEVPVSFTAAIAAGAEHTCAVLADGTVRCWGLNNVGQLGYGNSYDPGKERIGDDETPESAGAVDLGGRTAIAVSVGDYHSCVILDDRAVRCWRLNEHGQLGYGLGPGYYDEFLAVGDDETPALFPNVDLGLGRTAKAIAAGGAHTCAILDNDQVLCWGWGASGRPRRAAAGRGPSSAFETLPSAHRRSGTSRRRCRGTSGAGGSMKRSYMS